MEDSNDKILTERTMNKTLNRVLEKLRVSVTEEWEDIVKAYENHGYDLTVNAKIVLDGESLNVVQIATGLSYYPLPKTEIKTDKTTIDELQTQLFE